MAERQLNTRIKLRYASYTEWMASSVQLLPGEVAVCHIEANNSDIKNTAPTVLFKVGDGEHVFKDLKWSSARAADVYDWAKEEHKPTYTKSEVGLDKVRNVESYAKTETYSKEEVNAKIQEIQGALEADTNTTYRFDLGKANEITIYSKNIGEEEVEVGTFSVNFEELLGEIAAIKQNIKTIEDNIDAIEEDVKDLQDNKADKTQLADYYTKNEADGKFLVASDITGKAETTYVDEELAKKVDLGTYNTAINGINGKISDIEGDITDINNKFNDYTTTEVLEGQLALKADKTQVAADIKVVDDKFANYYKKEEADAEFMTQDEVDARINKIITDAVDGDALTSLTELVRYINTHGGEAAEMALAIDALESKLAGIDGTVAKYVSDAIDALKIGDYAKAEDLAALAARVAEIEKKPAMGITSDDIANWNSAEQNAKDYVDGKIKEVNDAAKLLEGRVKDIEDDYLTSSDKEELSGLIAVEKGRVDELVNKTIPALDDRVKVLEAKPFDTYATKTEVEAVDKKADGIDTRLQAVEADYLKKQDKEDVIALVNTEKKRAQDAEKALSDRVKVVEDDYLSSKDVIIWDCGGAN